MGLHHAADNFDMTASLDSICCPLPHLGVIRVQGEDAASFLHNQLTQDVVLLDPQHARLAAWCNAKGRMLANFVLCKPQSDEVLLIVSRDVLPPTLKRLSMFVLRAKVKLTDGPAQVHRSGRALASRGPAQRCTPADALSCARPATRHLVGPDGLSPREHRV